MGFFRNIGINIKTYNPEDLYVPGDVISVNDKYTLAVREETIDDDCYNCPFRNELSGMACPVCSDFSRRKNFNINNGIAFDLI